ncbi:conserved exported hypothetical protein [Enhydrobacter sp. 8BJ]|nr:MULTISPECIES: excalibur calcium-binding domain-containing protein [Pseudomonadota]VXB85689.1 conserved exported hypothetical protein [Enhydrobacter sp. 8BJ]
MKKYLTVILVSALMASPAMARVSCKSFKNQVQAQAHYNAKKQGWRGLDRDGDGRACDCLPGGSGKNCPAHKGKKK